MTDSIDIKVYYEDTDCGGVVYYGKYLGFLERARTEYLESRGVALDSLMREGICFVVTRVEIDYRSSARYADVLSVRSIVEEVRPASLVFRHTIVRRDEPDRVLVAAAVKLACVGPDMRPRRLTEAMLGALKAAG